MNINLGVNMTTISELGYFLLIGMGGTILLDIWAWVLSLIFGISSTNWALVGRWIANLIFGRLTLNHPKSEAIRGELVIGWLAHYLIGISYGIPLFIIWGENWLTQPTVNEPIYVSWILLIAPFLIMMPGLGAGIAGDKTPNPTITRIKSFAGHTIFGIGMFCTAKLIQILLIS